MTELNQVRLYTGNEFDPKQKGKIMVRGILDDRGFSEIILQRNLLGKPYIIVDNKKIYLKIEVSIDEEKSA